MARHSSVFNLPVAQKAKIDKAMSKINKGMKSIQDILQTFKNPVSLGKTVKVSAPTKRKVATKKDAKKATKRGRPVGSGKKIVKAADAPKRKYTKRTPAPIATSPVALKSDVIPESKNNVIHPVMAATATPTPAQEAAHTAETSQQLATA